MSRLLALCMLATAVCILGCPAPVRPPPPPPPQTFTPDIGFQALSRADFDQFGEGDWHGAEYQVVCQ